MMDEVDDQALDVGAVLILAGHDHHLAIPQAFDVVHGLVLLLYCNPTILTRSDISLFGDLLDIGFPHVQQLPLQRVDSIVVLAHHADPRHGQSLGRVSLSEDQGTPRTISLASSNFGIRVSLEVFFPYCALPNLFSALNSLHISTDSMIPALATSFLNLSESSHSEPKLLATKIIVSLD